MMNHTNFDFSFILTSHSLPFYKKRQYSSLSHPVILGLQRKFQLSKLIILVQLKLSMNRKANFFYASQSKTRLLLFRSACYKAFLSTQRNHKRRCFHPLFLFQRIYPFCFRKERCKKTERPKSFRFNRLTFPRPTNPCCRSCRGTLSRF